MHLQKHFFHCGHRNEINGATLLTQKTTPITGAKRKQKTAKNTVKFTPHDGGKILMLDYKKRSLVDLRYLVQCHLGKSSSLTQDDYMVMKKRKSTKLRRCKSSNVKGKQIFSKPCYRATLNTVSRADNKKNIKYDVNDKKQYVMLILYTKCSAIRNSSKLLVMLRNIST